MNPRRGSSERNIRYYYKKTKGCKKVAKAGLCGKKGALRCPSGSSTGVGGFASLSPRASSSGDGFHSSSLIPRRASGARLNAKRHAGKDKSGKKVRGTDACCNSCAGDTKPSSGGGGGGTCADGSTGDLSGYCRSVGRYSW